MKHGGHVQYVNQNEHIFMSHSSSYCSRVCKTSGISLNHFAEKCIDVLWKYSMWLCYVMLMVCFA